MLNKNIIAMGFVSFFTDMASAYGNYNFANLYCLYS